MCAVLSISWLLLTCSLGIAVLNITVVLPHMLAMAVQYWSEELLEFRTS